MSTLKKRRKEKLEALQHSNQIVKGRQRERERDQEKRKNGFFYNLNKRGARERVKWREEKKVCGEGIKGDAH